MGSYVTFMFVAAFRLAMGSIKPPLLNHSEENKAAGA
jgi:hypothetical protein